MKWQSGRRSENIEDRTTAWHKIKQLAIDTGNDLVKLKSAIGNLPLFKIAFGGGNREK